MCTCKQKCKCHHRHGCTGPVGPTGPMGPINPDGSVGSTGPMGPMGPMGPTGPMGSEGQKGEKGDIGPTGPLNQNGTPGQTGPTGPAGQSQCCLPFVFASSESVNRNDFIGCGNSSSDYLRNTVVVPVGCQTNYLVFHIRQFSGGKQYTATLWKNGSPTSLVAILPPGVSAQCTIGTGNVELNACDLLSVQITFDNGNTGALSDGCCATIYTKSNSS